MLKQVMLCFLAGSGNTPADLAQEYKQTVQTYMHEHVLPWVESKELVKAIEEQNIRNQNLTAADIATLDAEWSAEISRKDQPLIASVLKNPVSKFLEEKLMESGNAISEIIVMDAKGMNVGISGVTSDIYQGDEDKYRKTFLVGKDSEFVGDLEKDESTQTLVSVISRTVTDDKGHPIGAISIAISLDGID